MTAALTWYAGVQVLGVAAYLLAAPSFRRLPDGGYGVSKALGVLMLGALVWLGSAFGLLRNEPVDVALTAGALVLGAAAAGRRRPWPGWRILVTYEAIFAAAFIAWCLIRSRAPDAVHTEQPMDLMLLTAVSASPTVPPADPWLSGYAVGYYYLGYWLISSLGFLTGQPPQVSYTLGQACWFALLVLGTFSLGFNLLAASGASHAQRRLPLAAGAVTALLVAVSGNLRLLVERFSAASSASAATATDWWWWRSSRALHDVSPAGRPIELITEFPFFSYLLGDVHPHLLAMPFVVLAVTAAFALLPASPDAVGGHAEPTVVRRNVYARSDLLLAMVITGALVALNTWDLPAALGVLVMAAAWPEHARPMAWRALTIAMAAVAVTAVVYFPYLVTAQSQVQGLVPNLWHPTAIGPFLTMFGTLVPGVAVLAWQAWQETRPPLRRLATAGAVPVLTGVTALVASAAWTVSSSAGRAWVAGVTDGVDRPLVVALSRWAAGWPLPLLACALGGGLAALLAARRGRGGADGVTFGLMLAVTGLGLVTLPEFVYVRDLFGTRMNTVFKFYYQAWFYLAAAGTLGIGLAWVRGGRDRAFAVAALAIAACGLPYPVLAVRSALETSTAPAPTLDALAFLRRQAPDEWAGIEWVRQHTAGGTVIAQAPGDSYHADQSLVSTVTGRPTLIGWQGHERQWRGGAYAAMTAGRLEALRQIYRPVSAETLLAALDRWQVDVVWVGRHERRHYAMTAGDDALLGRVMAVAFEQGAVRVYRRRD